MADDDELGLLGGHRRWNERALIRLLLCTLIGVGAGASFDHNIWIRGLIGWNCGSTALLGLNWWIIFRSDPARTQTRASSSDPGSTAVWVLLLLACIFSLVASVLMMGDHHNTLQVLCCLWAVLGAWFVTHTSFTLRYAHLFYGDDHSPKRHGLTFPGEDSPDDLDFAYFSFTVGMCFQVSDVTVEDRAIRRTVLFHAILSFFYNTAILALALNLILNNMGSLNRPG